MKRGGNGATARRQGPGRKQQINRSNGRVIRINGVLCQLQSVDLDGDGKTGGIEKIKQKSTAMINLSNRSELRDTYDEMNKDETNPQTKMNAIDMRARIDNNFEETGLVMLNSIVSLGVYPEEVRKLALSKMRISVSRKGKGREEMRDVAIGSREYNQKKGMTLLEKAKHFATSQKDKGQQP